MTLVEKPLFVCGTGRSGTTLLLELLAKHPVVDTPTGRNWIEPYHFWQEAGFFGFARPCRDLREADAIPSKAIANIRNIFGGFCEPTHRFLTKYTGWPRAGFIRRIFPDARFIHIMRDGRDVAYSLMQQSWWHGWQGPDQWRWGQLDPFEYETWKTHGRSFFVLAGLQWSRLEKAYRSAGNRYLMMTVRYEDLCDSPDATIREICKFAELPLTETTIAALKSANGKWRHEIHQCEQADFDRVLGSTLREFGYD